MIIKTKDTTLDKKTGIKYKEINFSRNLRLLRFLIIVVGMIPLVIKGIDGEIWISSLITITILYFVLPLRYLFIRFEKVDENSKYIGEQKESDEV